MTLCVLATLATGAASTGLAAVAEREALWQFWPGFVPGAALWIALSLRDVNRWEREHDLQVIIRPDAPTFSWRRVKDPYLVVPYGVTTPGDAPGP